MKFWTNWGLPLLIVGALVGVCGAVVSATMNIPLSDGLAWGVVLVAGFGAYFFGEFHFYAVASRALGFRCEMRPMPKPRSALGDADIVISGTFRGQPFTLYRDGKNSPFTSASSATRAASPVVYSVTEWSDEAMRFPEFSIQLGPTVNQTSTVPGVRDALASLVDRGRVESEPGLLVLRELPSSDVWTSRKGKFPYPWEISEYLEHADQVRRVLVT
jgi:hypothetical protein